MVYAIGDQKQTTTAAAHYMCARSLNCQNCFKLSENNESVFKSGQNRVEILRFSDLVFQSENRYPGGYQNQLGHFAALVILEKISVKISQKSNRKIEICHFEILAQISDPGGLKILLDNFRQIPS